MTFSNALITGGTGFVAYWMNKTKPENMNIWLMSRKDYNDVTVETITGIDYIVHLAPVNPGQVIRCAQRNKARLLYCSSGIVYYPEVDSNYRRNKLTWEKDCLFGWENTVIARLFTFHGKKLDKSKAISVMFDAARKGKPVEVWGDCVRSYMHGAEMGRWMWAILLRGKAGQAYDVGSDMPITMLELASRIQTFTGCKVIEVPHKIPMPEYLPDDIAKTKKLMV